MVVSVCTRYDVVVFLVSRSFLDDIYMGNSRSLFLYFSSFLTLRKVIKKLLTAGFKPGSSGVGSNYSTNYATTTATLMIFKLVGTMW